MLSASIYPEDARTPCASLVIPAGATPFTKNGRVVFTTEYSSPVPMPAAGRAGVSHTFHGVGRLASEFPYKISTPPCGRPAEVWVQLNASSDSIVVQLKLVRLTDDSNSVGDYGVARFVAQVDQSVLKWSPPPRGGGERCPTNREHLLAV